MRFFIPLTLAASALLTGCTTPSATKAVAEELQRLCETKAGLTVYLPDRWRPATKTTPVPCRPVDAANQCALSQEGGYFRISSNTVLPRMGTAHIVEYRHRYVDSQTRELIAESLSYGAQGPAPLLSDFPEQTFSCSSFRHATDYFFVRYTSHATLSLNHGSQECV